LDLYYINLLNLIVINGLLKKININPTLFNRLDEGEKNLIRILALSVPMAAIVTGVVFYYAIQITLESMVLAAIGGTFIGYISFLHDSSMLSEKGKGRAQFRLVLSILFALILAVPVKVKLMGDSIQTVYLKQIEEYNLDINDQLLQAKQLIYKEEEAINDQIARAGKRLDKNSKNTQFFSSNWKSNLRQKRNVKKFLRLNCVHFFMAIFLEEQHLLRSLFIML